MPKKVTYSKFLNTDDVKDLGSALIELADRYPLALRTERDFFPLVEAYLHGRVPVLQAESNRSGGRVDFRVGGNNPALLELAVAPRALKDPNDESVTFPGNKYKSQLYAVANKPELAKLAKEKGAKARYLLLLDLRGEHDNATLQAGYEKLVPKDKGHAPVTVVYVCKSRAPFSFSLGGQKRGRRRAGAA